METSFASYAVYYRRLQGDFIEFDSQSLRITSQVNRQPIHIANSQSIMLHRIRSNRNSALRLQSSSFVKTIEEQRFLY